MKIIILAIGGGANNVFDSVIATGIEGCELILVNTDADALFERELTGHFKRLLIGQTLTWGLGSGADPDVGKKSAEVDINHFKIILKGANLVIIVASMGGGTGSGASSVIARLTRKLGVRTIAVISMPYGFEGYKCNNIAKQQADLLTWMVEDIYIFKYELMLNTLGHHVTLLEAFESLNNQILDKVNNIVDYVRKGISL
tara:strand:- start:1311 stop:1910 length:600 start_codon:yes stop_codon:yes gene_type:complete